MIWKRFEIQRARRTPLKPVLEEQGYSLETRPDGNYRVLSRPPEFGNADRGLPDEIIVKDHYWVCPDDGSAGNSIDCYFP